MLHKISPENFNTMKEKYITRYEASKGQGYTFVGWRLCITRKGERFVRYFSDLKLGGPEKSLEAARKLRDMMLLAMERGEADYKTLFNEFRRWNIEL